MNSVRQQPVASEPQKVLVPSPDEVIHKWATECERIYDERIAGDFTWHGVLFNFQRDFLASIEAVKATITEKSNA